MELKLDLLDSWLIRLSVLLMGTCLLLSGTAEDCRQGRNVWNSKYICNPRMCTLMVLLFYEIGVHGKNILQNSCDSLVSRTVLWLYCT
jgi:hypothetical protein